jgi:hypothetical protein
LAWLSTGSAFWHISVSGPTQPMVQADVMMAAVQIVANFMV